MDVPLSQKGVDEALEAGKRICDIPVDLIFTSALIRAQMTAMLAMTQHRKKKVTTANGCSWEVERVLYETLANKFIYVAGPSSSLLLEVRYIQKTSIVMDLNKDLDK